MPIFSELFGVLNYNDVTAPEIYLTGSASMHFYRANINEPGLTHLDLYCVNPKSLLQILVGHFTNYGIVFDVHQIQDGYYIFLCDWGITVSIAPHYGIVNRPFIKTGRCLHVLEDEAFIKDLLSALTRPMHMPEAVYNLWVWLVYNDIQDLTPYYQDIRAVMTIFLTKDNVRNYLICKGKDNEEATVIINTVVNFLEDVRNIDFNSISQYYWSQWQGLKLKG